MPAWAAAEPSRAFSPYPSGSRDLVAAHCTNAPSSPTIMICIHGMLQVQLDNGASIAALRRFDRNLRALTLENWGAASPAHAYSIRQHMRIAYAMMHMQTHASRLLSLHKEASFTCKRPCKCAYTSTLNCDTMQRRSCGRC